MKYVIALLLYLANSAAFAQAAYMAQDVDGSYPEGLGGGLVILLFMAGVFVRDAFRASSASGLKTLAVVLALVAGFIYVEIIRMLIALVVLIGLAYFFWEKLTTRR